MSDGKFTKIAVGLLTNARDLVDWGIAGGHTTAEQLRLTVSAPKEAVAQLHEQGLSQRQIAKAVGCDHKTVGNDMRGEHSPRSGESPHNLHAMPSAR